MAKKNKKVRRTIVSIGSSHIGAALVEWDNTASPSLIDFRESSATSLFRGQPTSVEQITEEIRSLLNTLGGPRASGGRDVHVLISHAHLKQYEFETGLTLGLEHDQINERDVRLVHEQTRRVINIPLNEKIIASHVQEYTVNDLVGIRNPIGLAGERLAVKLALFTAPYVFIQQVEKIFERCDIMVRTWYPRSLALAKAVLEEESIRRSALLIQIGSTLTELIGLENFGIRYFHAIPVGIETVAELMQEEHTMERQEALAVTEQYGAFGVRPHREEKIPFRSGEGVAQGFVTSGEFNGYLESGIGKITAQIFEEIQKAIPNFTQTPKLFVSGRGINMGQLLERLENKCETHMAIASGQRRNIGHSSLCSSPLLGRGILLEEEEKAEQQFRNSIHPVKKVTGAALEWMREHF